MENLQAQKTLRTTIMAFAAMTIFLASCYSSVPPNLQPDSHDAQDSGPEDPTVEDPALEDMDAHEPDPIVDLAEDVIVEDIPAEDTAPDVEPGTCTFEDLVYQSLCGPGLKCTISETADCIPSVACREPGPQGENESCLFGSEGDNCMSGTYCFGDLVEDNCRKFCSMDSQCHGENSACLIKITGPDCPGGLRAVTLCSHDCDYFYQTGCRPGQACRMLVEHSLFHVFSDCTTAGTGVQGASCPNGSTDCAAGYGCFEVDDGSAILRLCLKLCNYMGGYPTCDYGYSCQRGTDWPSPAGSCL